MSRTVIRNLRSALDIKLLDALFWKKGRLIAVVCVWRIYLCCIISCTRAIWFLIGGRSFHSSPSLCLCNHCLCCDLDSSKKINPMESTSSHNTTKPQQKRKGNGKRKKKERTRNKREKEGEKKDRRRIFLHTIALLPSNDDSF